MLRACSIVLCSTMLVACSSDANPEVDEELGSEVPETAGDYQGFPDGFDYMVDPKALEAAVISADRAFVRRHGWNLWAGIMQPGRETGWPVWQTWPNTTAAFAGGVPPEQGCDNDSVPSSNLRSVRQHGRANVIDDNLALPNYILPEVVREEFPSAIFTGSNGACSVIDGRTFQNNGDIMIVTESLSIEGYDWIRGKQGGENSKLYEQETLENLHQAMPVSKVNNLDAPQRYIVTKHMYWPVLSDRLGVLPVWNGNFGPEYAGYAGYERWDTMVAIDPTGSQVGETVPVEYLRNDVDYSKMPADQRPSKPIVGMAEVVSLDQFYFHKVTDDDWSSFNDADRAILNASSQWAYDDGFGPGDYLVTIAMHINTKEVPGWGLQSAYWSDHPDEGADSSDRPTLTQAEGPWAHYKLVDSYGIPDQPQAPELPVAMNPYIELVIHPVATNCQTCHSRAGWPHGNGPGQSSYQPADGGACRSLLANLNPSSPCLKGIFLTDMQWIITDRAIE